MPNRLTVELVGVIFALVLALIGLWQYQVVKSDLSTTQQQLTELQESQRQSQVVIAYQEFAIQQYRTYSEDLAAANQRAAERAARAIKQFETQRREDPIVRDWAAQPIPPGLLKSERR